MTERQDLTTRQQLLQQVADLVIGKQSSGILRVAVDGVDGAGKTTFAGELAAKIDVSLFDGLECINDLLYGHVFGCVGEEFQHDAVVLTGAAGNLDEIPVSGIKNPIMPFGEAEDLFGNGPLCCQVFEARHIMSAFLSRSTSHLDSEFA